MFESNSSCSHQIFSFFHRIIHRLPWLPLHTVFITFTTYSVSVYLGTKFDNQWQSMHREKIPVTPSRSVHWTGLGVFSPFSLSFSTCKSPPRTNTRSLPNLCAANNKCSALVSAIKLDLFLLFPLLSPHVFLGRLVYLYSWIWHLIF
jgi:hypothetical protein